MPVGGHGHLKSLALTLGAGLESEEKPRGHEGNKKQKSSQVYIKLALSTGVWWKIQLGQHGPLSLEGRPPAPF